MGLSYRAVFVFTVSVTLQEVSSIEVFSFERCLPETDVFHGDVSAVMSCWPYKGVCLKIVCV